MDRGGMPAANLAMTESGLVPMLPDLDFGFRLSR